MTRHCFCFPSGSLCVFVSCARPLSPNCECWCVLECGNKQEKSVKMWGADIFEGRIIPLCVSEDNLNYNCIAAQSRDLSQAQTKPCWTRLNQAWTFSTRRALRFKPRLIGPKASKKPLPSCDGHWTGKREGERKKEERKKEAEILSFRSIYKNPCWINFILLFSSFSFFLNPFLAQMQANPRCCILPIALSELKVMCGHHQQPRQSGQPNRRSMWRGLHNLLQHVFLPVCQFKDRDWMSQVHLTAVCNSRGPSSLTTSRRMEDQMQNNCMSWISSPSLQPVASLFHPLLWSVVFSLWGENCLYCGEQYSSRRRSVCVASRGGFCC